MDCQDITPTIPSQPTPDQQSPFNHTNLKLHLCVVGDVREFGFQEIPDDENFHSYFSVNIPTTDAEGGAPQGDSDPSGGKPPGQPPAGASQEGGQPGSWFSGSGATVSSWMPWSKKPETVRALISDPPPHPPPPPPPHHLWCLGGWSLRRCVP